jgi:hypothetical protein
MISCTVYSLGRAVRGDVSRDGYVGHSKGKLRRKKERDLENDFGTK